MALFSTSNITCNERPSVGRNFRDTINESASPINRFTEKVETRSFDEIFYEADIAIREELNSMNKLWYKSVLESDTIESAIINEANIFSKVVEVIKNIFEKVKKALSAMAKKVREFFAKIFKKKEKDKEGTENTESDDKETRGTSKESTPTSSSEETAEKVTKAVDDIEKLEKEKKELEKELEKAKKEEESKKKEDGKKAESKKDEPKKKPEPNKDSDSIDTKDIDTSSLDKPNKNKPKINNDMDSISVPDTSNLDSLNKKIEEKNKAIENKKKEIKTVASDNDGYPKFEDFNGDYAKFKQACIDYENAKDKAVKDTPATAEKGVVKGNEDNNATTKAVEKRLKELMEKYDEAAEVIKDNYKKLKNAPKIFPYFDLFTADQHILRGSGFLGGGMIENICKDVANHYKKNNPSSAVSIASSYINNGKFTESSFMLKDGKIDKTALIKSLQTKATLDNNDKNCIIATCFNKVDSNSFLVMPTGYYEKGRDIQAGTSLENFYRGASVNDGLVGTSSEKLFNEFSDTEVFIFLNNIKLCKTSSEYDDVGVISGIKHMLGTLEAGKNFIINNSYGLQTSLKNMKLEEDDKNYLMATVYPILQKAVGNIASLCAQSINDVCSTRLRICTEAYGAGNKMYNEILRLCVRHEVLNNKK